MREIVLDTETTGLYPLKGDRIVDIGCVELENHMPTGRTFQCYLNPDKVMDEEVIAVHGLTNEFLADKPRFEDVADDFLAFVGDAKLVIHNASFDMLFLNVELERCGRPKLPDDQAIDTLVLARQQFPGSRVNLNELCKRFNIDTSARTVHGALLDSELLAAVYLELVGGREPGLVLDAEQRTVAGAVGGKTAADKPFREPRIFPVPPEEEAAHHAFMLKIKDNLWGITHE